jgi:uncharacterized protein (TIGR00369 family)
MCSSGYGRRKATLQMKAAPGAHFCYSGAVTTPEPQRAASRRVRDSRVTLHQFMLPAHANPMGNVHGGVILKIADEAAAICAMRHAHRQCVTVAIDSVSFHSPVHVGQLLALEASLTYVGRTSLEVRVRVHAEDPIRGSITHTNSAYFVFVALDEQGQVAPVPPLELETDEERLLFAEGSERQKLRVARARPA